MTVTATTCDAPSTGRYSNHGCRCDGCREAIAEWRRQRRSSIARELGAEWYCSTCRSWADTPTAIRLHIAQSTRCTGGYPRHEWEGHAIDWMDRAACRDLDTDFMFPPDGAGVNQAIAVCAACPVRDDCLHYALEHRIDHGVWGGVSERGRRALLRTRRETA